MKIEIFKGFAGFYGVTGNYDGAIDAEPGINTLVGSPQKTETEAYNAFVEELYQFGYALTIQTREGAEFVEVSPWIFRSWGGPRRIEGEDFEGPVFYLGTNKEADKPAASQTAR